MTEAIPPPSSLGRLGEKFVVGGLCLSVTVLRSEQPTGTMAFCNIWPAAVTLQPGKLIPVFNMHFSPNHALQYLSLQ